MSPMVAAAEEDGLCAQCGGRGWIIVEDPGCGTARRCGCRKGRDVPTALSRAKIPQRYESCRLLTFRASHRDTEARDQLLMALAESRRYLETFLQGNGKFRESGLLFVGPPGVGKTHLAVAILAELIETYGVRGRFVDFTSLIHEIQSTFSPGAPASKRAILDPIQKAELLVLDELGAQKPSPWVSDLLYLIINSRYAHRRPTIFTSNYRLEDKDGNQAEIDQRWLLSSRIPHMLVSRLYEMAKPVYLDAVGDYRREIQMHQHLV